MCRTFLSFSRPTVVRNEQGAFVVQAQTGTRVRCDVCGLTVSEYCYKRTHANGKCSGQLKLSQAFPFEPHPEDPMRCPETTCDFKGTTVRQAQSHYRLRHQKVPCQECGKMVGFHALKSHLIKVHKLTTVFNQKVSYDHSCEKCGKCFYTKGELESHAEDMHNTVESHFCETCGKGFVSKRKLHTHDYRTHRGGRYYSCEDCGLKTESKKTMIEHLTEVHKKDLPEDYVPPRPGQVFK